MANRREEERERLRQARQERESSQGKADKRRLFAVYGVAGLIGLLVVAGIVAAISSSGGSGSGGEAHINLGSGSSNGVKPDNRSGPAPPPVKVTSLKQAAKQAGCALRLNLKEEGHSHIPPTSPTPDYKTNPPTSGNHVEPPYQQADGAYSEMPGEIFFVHSLEHGRLEIQYSPELPEEDQLALKGLYETLYKGALLFPNENMDYQVAVTSWRNLLGCTEYKGAITLDAIRDFGKAKWGSTGREPATGFGFSEKGPTPLEPEETAR
ncbi:MAG TPA: DUF3105 domain-containing protein [Solirubrobacterales bacterium]|nr:DUF3105 domain-containing protein [Solirubrobacterales bacterium]